MNAATEIDAGSITGIKTVTIYTDGACKGNPGPGGWGVLLLSGDTEKERGQLSLSSFFLVARVGTNYILSVGDHTDRSGSGCQS